MTSTVYIETLSVCQRHADRLVWAMQAMEKHLPFSADTLGKLTDVEMAILDQFTVRFAKLQDVMGAKLFPAELNLAVLRIKHGKEEKSDGWFKHNIRETRPAP